MKEQHWMSKNFFIFFFTWGIFLPYWTGWLHDAKGFGVEEAGVIMGLGLVVRGISTMSFYPLLSNYLSQKKLLFYLTLGSLLVSFLYLPSSSYTSVLIVPLLFCVLYPCLLPALENSAGILVQKSGIHYGKSRSYGSLGYVVAVFMVSALTPHFGDGVILYIMMIGLALLFLLRFFPSPASLSEGTEDNQNQIWEITKNLFKEKTFLVVLVITILLHGSHASYYSFGYIYLQDKGLAGISIGVLLNIAVLFEILYFSQADRILTKWKPSSLLLTASIAGSIRWILYCVPSLWTFILSQTLHALSFGMTHYAFIRYITKHFSPKENAIAQGLYSAIAMSFSTALLTLAGGYLYEWKPEFAFLGMLVCTIPASLILLKTRNQYHY